MSDTPQDPRIAVLASLLAVTALSCPPDVMDAVDALAALDAVDPARVWRPIAEAPRDGRLLMVWLPPQERVDGAPYCFARYYSEACDPEFWDGDEGWLTPEGDYVDPTHFLPLPEPPEGA